mmetsp:Transcript_10263/g.13477  ORF Transcript_10263/g.13477 Transcript_10263/m.13477 type:complete len:86 (-) Transcript_10263:2-259(-)
MHVSAASLSFTNSVESSSATALASSNSNLLGAPSTEFEESRSRTENKKKNTPMTFSHNFPRIVHLQKKLDFLLWVKKNKTKKKKQ